MGRPFVKGGTPVGSISLCGTCTSAHIMRGYRESELITICNDVNPNIVVPFTIYECSGYYDKNRPDWNQMQKLAIDVPPAPLKPVGFKTGTGFREAACKKVKAGGVDRSEDGDDESDDE
jgi:hypothetical protein